VLCCVLRAGAEPGWHQVGFSYQVNATAVRSDSEAWAAGTAGNYLSGFFRWDGASWSLADTFRNQLVYDIAVSGESAWAVGEQFNFPDGVVWHWDGSHWLLQTDPFDRTLQAVSFPDPEHGFAGGASPVQHHPAMLFRAGEWRIDSSLTTNRVILGMAATYQGKCYAVGDSGSIFRFHDSAWTQLRTLTPQHLRRVAMESNTEGWAVGDHGVILRCFKDTWGLAPSPTTRNLRGLAIAGTSGEAWAVGDSGTILHCVRDSWHLEPFVPDPADVPLYTVSFSSGTHGWAFGYQTYGAQVALHYCDPLATEGPMPRSDRRLSVPTIVRGVLEIGPQPAANSLQPGIGLLDISGRKVMALRSGPNDVSRLASGVYFITDQESGGRGRGEVWKVVVQH
jgi:photosystem II stability/assembly factor-like uncharacterized protein